MSEPAALDDEDRAREPRALRVSEIFDSLQGEGINAGAPCRFVRLALCNLHCSYCDTKYTWDFERFEYAKEVREMSVAELAERVTAAPSRHVVITGGEPLLQQPGLEAILASTPSGVFVELETNGTIMPTPSLLARVNQWNVSPKLSSAGDPLALRVRRSVLETLCNAERSYLKLVVTTKDDRDEAEALRAELAWPKERTLLMPEATTSELLARRSPAVAGFARGLGVRFSSRLHVALWGDRRGV